MIINGLPANKAQDQEEQLMDAFAEE